MKSCLDCGALIRRGSRCAKHQAPIERARQRRQPYRKGYKDAAYAQTSVRAIWVRDRGVCQIGGEPCPLSDATKDHIVPLSQGGSNDPANLRLVCRSHNSSRGGSRG